MTRFSILIVGIVCFFLTFGSPAQAQPLLYPGSAPNGHSTYGSPYQPSTSNSQIYNPYHDPNDRRYDGSRFGSNQLDNDLPNRSYQGRSSGTSGQPYDSRYAPLPYRNDGAQYNDPYQSNQGVRKYPTDDRGTTVRTTAAARQLVQM